MNKQYQLRIDIMNMLLRFMVTFTILSMLLLLFTNDVDYVWRSLILFQSVVISFIIDKYTKYIWSYILLHLLLIAVYLFMQEDLVLRIAYGGYILTYAILQFALDLKERVRNTTLAFVVIFLFMYSICRYTYSEEVALGRLFFYLAIAYGLIYILNMNFINLYLYLEKHKDITNIPLKQIRASNRIYIIGFIYLSFISMIAFTRFPMDKLFQFFGKCIVKFLRFVFAGLTRKSYEEYVPEEELPEFEMPMGYQKIRPGDSRPSPFWEHLYQLIIILIITAVACMILMLLVLGLYHIYKLYYQKKVFEDGEEKVEVISPFHKSELSIFRDIRSPRSRLRNLFGKSNNDKIRKLYVKAVQKHTKPEQELKYDPPEKLSKYAITPDNKTSEEIKREKEESLTSLYEKARYSNEECSKEETQAAKNILK